MTRRLRQTAAAAALSAKTCSEWHAALDTDGHPVSGCVIHECGPLACRGDGPSKRSLDNPVFERQVLLLPS
jgi:hypothetical protein